jgi:predicted HTH domain antitoxin
MNHPQSLLQLEIKFTPLELLEIPKEHQQEAENKAKEAYVMTLLKYHHISAGKAASLLNINRWQLSELMYLYNISPFPEQTKEELEAEIAETIQTISGVEILDFRLGKTYQNISLSRLSRSQALPGNNV